MPGNAIFIGSLLCLGEACPSDIFNLRMYICMCVFYEASTEIGFHITIWKALLLVIDPSIPLFSSSLPIISHPIVTLTDLLFPSSHSYLLDFWGSVHGQETEKDKSHTQQILLSRMPEDAEQNYLWPCRKESCFPDKALYHSKP